MVHAEFSSLKCLNSCTLLESCIKCIAGTALSHLFPQAAVLNEYLDVSWVECWFMNVIWDSWHSSVVPAFLFSLHLRLHNISIVWRWSEPQQTVAVISLFLKGSSDVEDFKISKDVRLGCATIIFHARTQGCKLRSLLQIGAVLSEECDWLFIKRSSSVVAVQHLWVKCPWIY